MNFPVAYSDLNHPRTSPFNHNTSNLGGSSADKDQHTQAGYDTKLHSYGSQKHDQRQLRLPGIVFQDQDIDVQTDNVRARQGGGLDFVILSLSLFAKVQFATISITFVKATGQSNKLLRLA